MLWGQMTVKLPLIFLKTILTNLMLILLFMITGLFTQLFFFLFVHNNLGRKKRTFFLDKCPAWKCAHITLAHMLTHTHTYTQTHTNNRSLIISDCFYRCLLMYKTEKMNESNDDEGDGDIFPNPDIVINYDVTPQGDEGDVLEVICSQFSYHIIKLYCPCLLGCVIKSKNEEWERALWNQTVLLYKETGSKEKNLILDFLPTACFTLKIPGPLHKSKKKFFRL